MSRLIHGVIRVRLRILWEQNFRLVLPEMILPENKILNQMSTGTFWTILGVLGHVAVGGSIVYFGRGVLLIVLSLWLSSLLLALETMAARELHRVKVRVIREAVLDGTD